VRKLLYPSIYSTKPHSISAIGSIFSITAASPSIGIQIRSFGIPEGQYPAILDGRQAQLLWWYRVGEGEFIGRYWDL
jgi:hypothetical protein